MTCVQCTNCGHEILVGDSCDDLAAKENLFAGTDESSEGFADQAQRALRERISITCSGCGEKMRLPMRMTGRKVRCKSCSKMLLIPNMEGNGQLDENAPKSTGIFTAGGNASGKPYSGDDGVFDVVLQKGSDSLRGKLRILDDGNTVIFYLRNSPMYQITYYRDGTK